MRPVLIAASAACLTVLSFQAVAQEAPPRPSYDDLMNAPLPETFEQLPADVRARFKEGAVRLQAALTISPAAGLGQTQTIEAGALIAQQSIAPVKGVRLTSAPRRPNYGGVGSILWLVRENADESWCWRDPARPLGRPGPVYCYRDKDKDGSFDALFEHPSAPIVTAFQVFARGKDETIQKPVTYEPAAPPEFKELAAIRYQGVTDGLIGPEGRVGPGIARFDLVVGPDKDRLEAISSRAVLLDVNGNGVLNLSSGHRIRIEDVQVDGRARIVVESALMDGEGFLFPPATRESYVEGYRDEVLRLRAQLAALLNR